MKIRPLEPSDYEQLHQLYRRQTSSVPFHHQVRRDQFTQDLLTTRFIRNPAAHHAKARIALVATSNGKVRAFVSGGMVTEGDEVVAAGTGYIQAILAERGATSEVKDLVGRVVRHLRRYRPQQIYAQHACLSPVFFADSVSSLSTRWAWIGQVLLDAGFTVSSRSLRLVAPLDRPRHPVHAPDDLEFFHLRHEMHGFNPKFDFGCLLLKPPYAYGDGVVWCGNFYSGMFVKGSGHRSLYTNWFTILDDAYRGRGLGRVMLRYCLQQAQQRGARYASLLTHVDNFVTQNLYLSEGFEIADMTHTFELPLTSSAPAKGQGEG